jgi:hypothetical protein
MPWKWDPKAPKMERNNKTLVCYEMRSPAAMIVLNPDSNVAEISFNQTLNEDAVSSSANKAASLAIAAIKILGIPFEMQEGSFIYKECKINNYRENLPKILIYLAPESKDSLLAALDEAGAFEVPLAPQPANPTVAATKPKAASGKTVRFSQADLKEYVKGSKAERKKALKHSSQYSREPELTHEEEEPVKAPPHVLHGPN